MSASPLVQLCVDILQPVKNPPRFDKQLAIENAIVQLRPDFVEATEILDALMAALSQKYSPAWLVVVEEEMKALKIALKEAEPCEITKEDLRFDDSRWCNVNE